MRRVSKGFTIIEVMIFFTVSALLFASAWSLIAGRQEQVMFDQKVRDTQSKLQQWISDVSTGITHGSPSQQYCVIHDNSPYIVDPIADPSNPPKPADYSPECIFLGKAIQFTDNNSSQASTLYVYSVFGCRLEDCHDNKNLAQNMHEANPEPAIGGHDDSDTFADLTETFDLSPAYITSVSGIDQLGSNSTSHMIGFMNSFNTDQNFDTANGSEDLSVYLYSLNDNYPPADPDDNNDVKKCLEGKNPCELNDPDKLNPPKLKSYKFSLSDGKYCAQITISSASGIGASTQLDYITC